MSKNIIISVGGTGGHVYPALALARQLQKAEPGVKIMFVGGNLSANRYFEKDDHLHKSVSCGNFNSKNPLKCLNGAGAILKGMWQSRKIMKEFKPDLVVGFGSYYTFPTLLAAKMLNVPILLHEANSIPGKVNRLLSRHAVATGVHFPATADLLDGSAYEVGMPLREGFAFGSVTRKQARDYYYLDCDKLTLLIFGGSQGAQSINHLFSEAILNHYHGDMRLLQVIHLTGDPKLTSTLESAYKAKGIKACVKEFEKRMDFAWQAADLMISRSGAGTIAEQMEFEVPGILIPYPRATDNHQNLNAQFMAKTVGGAVMFNEDQLTPAILAERLQVMLNHDLILLHSMRLAMREYKNKTRRSDLCTLVLDVLEKKA